MQRTIKTARVVVCRNICFVVSLLLIGLSSCTFQNERWFDYPCFGVSACECQYSWHFYARSDQDNAVDTVLGLLCAFSCEFSKILKLDWKSLVLYFMQQNIGCSTHAICAKLLTEFNILIWMSCSDYLERVVIRIKEHVRCFGRHAHSLQKSCLQIRTRIQTTSSTLVPYHLWF